MIFVKPIIIVSVGHLWVSNRMKQHTYLGYQKNFMSNGLNFTLCYISIYIIGRFGFLVATFLYFLLFMLAIGESELLLSISVVVQYE